MSGWIRNPRTCGKITYALALLESQTRSNAYFTQDPSYVPCCRLDISLVNYLLICHTGARPIPSLEYSLCKSHLLLDHPANRGLLPNLETPFELSCHTLLWGPPTVQVRYRFTRNTEEIHNHR